MPAATTIPAVSSLGEPEHALGVDKINAFAGPVTRPSIEMSR